MENYHAAATWMKLREEPHNFLKKLPAKVGSQAVAVKKLSVNVGIGVTLGHVGCQGKPL